MAKGPWTEATASRNTTGNTPAPPGWASNPVPEGSPITTGQTLTLFALFAKRRNDVLQVLDALRRWRRSGPLRRVRPWPLRGAGACRGPQAPARGPRTGGGAVVGNELLAAPDATLVGVFRYRARLVRLAPGEGQIVSWAGHVVRG